MPDRSAAKYNFTVDLMLDLDVSQLAINNTALSLGVQIAVHIGLLTKVHVCRLLSLLLAALQTLSCRLISAIGS